MAGQQLIRLVSSEAGDDLALWVAAFLDDCALQHLSPRTVAFYRTNLGRFHWWCVTTGAPTDPALQRPGDLRDFLRYVQTATGRWGSAGHPMSDRPASASTLHAYFRTLHRFYAWLVEQEAVPRSPMEHLRAPRLERAQPDPFRDEELARLAASLRAGEGILADRNRAMVAVLLDTGLRASELAGLRVGDVDLTTGRLVVVRGKGAKRRDVFAGAAARRALRRYWMRWRRGLGDDPEGRWFLADDGEPLTAGGVHEMTTALGRRAGVWPSNPHRFRHSFAVRALRAGMSPFDVQLILGHESLDMTRRYAKLAEQDVQAATERSSPLDKLRLGL